MSGKPLIGWVRSMVLDACDARSRPDSLRRSQRRPPPPSPPPPPPLWSIRVVDYNAIARDQARDVQDQSAEQRRHLEEKESKNAGRLNGIVFWCFGAGVVWRKRRQQSDTPESTANVLYTAPGGGPAAAPVATQVRRRSVPPSFHKGVSGVCVLPRRAVTVLLRDATHPATQCHPSTRPSASG